MEPHNFKLRNMKYNIIKKYFSFVLVLAVMLLFTSCESVQDKFNKLKELTDKSFAMYDEMNKTIKNEQDFFDDWIKKWTVQKDEMSKLIESIPEDEDFPDEEMTKVEEGYKLAYGMVHFCKISDAILDLYHNFKTYTPADWEAKAKEVEKLVTATKEDHEKGLIREEDWSQIQGIVADYAKVMGTYLIKSQGESTGTINFN